MLEAKLPDRRSIRLRQYDYTIAGSYFLTICSHRMRCVFGRVRNGRAELSPVGEVVRECWLAIPEHFPGVTLDEFVVMPNHLHGVLVNWVRADAACRVPTDPRDPGIAFPPYRAEAEQVEKFAAPVRASLPTIVRSFKGAVTRVARSRGVCGDGPLWHRGFYEHIIRRSESLEEIRGYIGANPERWMMR